MSIATKLKRSLTLLSNSGDEVAAKAHNVRKNKPWGEVRRKV